jgi:hypothetical protein
MLVLQRIRMSRVSIAQSMRVDRKRIWNRSRSDWKAILAVIASEEVNALIIVKKQSLRVKARSLRVRSDFEVISLRFRSDITAISLRSSCAITATSLSPALSFLLSLCLLFSLRAAPKRCHTLIHLCILTLYPLLPLDEGSDWELDLKRIYGLTEEEISAVISKMFKHSKVSSLLVC